MTTTILSQAPAITVKTSNHVGSIGDRVLVKGVFLTSIRFGRAYLNIIRDHDGNEFMLRSRNPYASSKGVYVATEGTIASHIEYRGVKRTELTNTTQMVYDRV